MIGLLEFYIPYSQRIWGGFNLAQGKNEISGADLISRSEKNIKFSADLIWRNWRIFDKFIKKYEQFNNVEQGQYQIF